MEIIKIIFANIIGSVRRNPLTFVVLLVLLVAAPWLFGVFAAIILAVLLIAALMWVPLIWRIRSAQREAEERMRNGGDTAAGEENGAGGGFGWFGGSRRTSKREGDVTVVETERTQKRVRDDVGEYVDFKEVEGARDDDAQAQ